MRSDTLLAALIGLMFIAFIIIRELWQKGTQPLKGFPGVSYIAIVVLIVFLIIIWYVHKKLS
jgi:MFS superfamily sulfate permease-like transporter